MTKPSVIELFRIARLPLLTLLCGQSLMVGSFAPWATAAGSGMVGVEGDGALTQVLGVYASILALMLTARIVPSRPVLWMLLVAFGVTAGTAVLNIADLDARVNGLDTTTDPSIGWGLLLVLGSSFAGLAVVGIQIARIYRD